MGSLFVFLLNRSIAVAVPVTVFIAAVFWRRTVKHGSVDDAQASSDSQQRVASSLVTESLLRHEGSHPPVHHMETSSLEGTPLFWLAQTAPLLSPLLLSARPRLCMEVASQFQEAARQCDSVRTVGLYGVGGLGKIAMCNIMCNFYISKYLGKSCHIEFPSDGDDKKIVQECRKALKKLPHLSDEHLLNKADSLTRFTSWLWMVS